MTGWDAAPLILTLRLDAPSFERFDGLRRAHFPPGRNLIPAHLTLFHHLPGEHLPEVMAVLGELGRLQRPFPLQVTGLRFLGRGVAFELAAPELMSLRAQLAEAWFGWLTPQDRQGFRPHVTIQNKVQPEAARALFEGLSAGFGPFAAGAEGLDLWRYQGGPWERAGQVGFAR